ncbi:MAG TPA: hypothetical protein VNV85_06860 [Puia sp.]|jgi:hypothetical protein|nr:hypothetical protein [Puia sp.]
MINIDEEKKERIKGIKILVARWITKQETAKKAELLLLKNPHIKLSKAAKVKTIV